MLAAHKNNYEILKILLDRGFSLPRPHDVKCDCGQCAVSSRRDSLRFAHLDNIFYKHFSVRFSMSRLNAYKALSSPSLIALTSKDPILTAFKLSNQLKSLSKMESQFCKEYTVLREQVQVAAISAITYICQFIFCHVARVSRRLCWTTPGLRTNWRSC